MKQTFSGLGGDAMLSSMPNNILVAHLRSIVRVLMRHVTSILLALIWVSPANALDTYELEELVGWTIVASSQVDGSFEGCDFDKKIRLANGMVLTCRTYSYSYSYRPKVIIFAQSVTHQGKNFSMIKALINDR